MSDRITEQKLYMKLYNHNAFTKYPLDIDALGASGGMGDHLIFLGTQNKLGPLMTKSQLWDLIGAIGDFEYQTGNQLEEPIQVWQDEYNRISEGGKIEIFFASNLAKTHRPTLKHPIGVSD